MKEQKTKEVVVPAGIPEKTNAQVTVIDLPKKKLSIAEKLDKIQSFDSINGKYEYLKECKENLKKFESSTSEVSNSKIILKHGYNSELTISNAIILEEIVKISKMRLKEQLIKVEREIEEFEI